MSPTTSENTFAYTVTQLPDTTAPQLQSVTPGQGAIELEYAENFILTVDASDNGLYELEIDHSMEGTLQEFSVYADTTNPYGTLDDKALFEAAGVDVTYDANLQKWEIDFGATITDAFVDNGGITFYLVVKDETGNAFGGMSPTTSENTFAYTVTQLPE